MKSWECPTRSRQLFADKCYHKAHERRVKRHKAQYSLDAEDGIEAAAITHSVNSPEAVLEIVERHCALCRALNSLPDIQGRRIDAHYVLGMSQNEIAEAEGVDKGSVSRSGIPALVATEIPERRLSPALAKGAKQFARPVSIPET